MNPPRLLRVCDWEKLAREAAFQPAVMAALCPISLRQMQRHFAARFDKTPGEWARELRCRLARQLIAEGWSNRAVAIELGFADESHFCRQFKRVFGVSPQRSGILDDATVGPAGRSQVPMSNHRGPAANRAPVGSERSAGAPRLTRPLRRRASTAVGQALSPSLAVARRPSLATSGPRLNNECRF